MEDDPRRKIELTTPIIAYPETLWKKQYRVMTTVLVISLLVFTPLEVSAFEKYLGFEVVP